jgi:hypothetical protein
MQSWSAGWPGKAGTDALGQNDATASFTFGAVLVVYRASVESRCGVIIGFPGTPQSGMTR